MRKKLAIMIAFMMVMSFTFAACGGGGGSSEDLANSKYVGTWKAESMTLGDETESADEGGEFILTLNGDGTGTFYTKENGGEEETTDINWELINDGFKTKGDTKMTFIDDGEGIKTNVLGVDLHFEKVDASAADTSEAAATPGIGAKYGYMGDDPVECAVWEYLADDLAENSYGVDDDVITTVPVVQVIKKEEGSNGDYYVAGDFWIYNYKTEGDTLVFVSGGAHPGKMHVVKDDDDDDNDNEYDVVEFVAVKDGGEYEPSAKEIFGDAYDKFAEVSSNSDAREELRLKGLADYVKANGLSVTKLQDGDTTVDLPL